MRLTPESQNLTSSGDDLGDPCRSPRRLTESVHDYDSVIAPPDIRPIQRPQPKKPAGKSRNLDKYSFVSLKRCINSLSLRTVCMIQKITHLALRNRCMEISSIIRSFCLTCVAAPGPGAIPPPPTSQSAIVSCDGTSMPAPSGLAIL